MPWLPKSVLCLPEYSAATLASDALAGVTVGLVALPLAMAFAITSGLSPQAGIYCAIVTGFTISLLGGSRCQVGGPTGAFVVVVAGIVARYGVDGLFMCTMMAGVILIGFGLGGLGATVRFIPRPVVVGFTNGIAVLIASTQVKDFLGLRIGEVPSDFIGRVHALTAHLSSWSPVSTALGVAALAVIVALQRRRTRLPGTIVALLLGTLVATWLDLPVETIGTRFGGIPMGLPSLHVPQFRPDLFVLLIPSALTVALLGAIESLLSAVVSDRMSGDRHNPNVELIAQGVANVLSPMVGGLPATGAIARTATNVRSGARTPVAGMIHALTLVAVLLAAAPLAQFIPLTVLAAILFVVAWNMGEWHEIPELFQLTKTDVSVWFATFALTVFADLTLAVEVGMVLAALLYIRRVADTTTVERVTSEYVEAGRPHVLQDKAIPPYVAIVRIHGPFLFGATDKLQPLLDAIDTLPPIVILRLRNMTALDGTGLLAIEELSQRVRASGRHLLVCGARRQPAELLAKAGLHRLGGAENVLPDVRSALARAVALHEAAARHRSTAAAGAAGDAASEAGR
ncbi:MAG: SulP family inorganic anion transporter [Deltaproteobacteria bacterium]|nr:SulP family inorganic anion transporter [Deltaproteobacteria bacterium]